MADDNSFRDAAAPAGLRSLHVIASAAKQSSSRAKEMEDWIASSHPPSPEGGLRRTRGLLAMTDGAALAEQRR